MNVQSILRRFSVEDIKEVLRMKPRLDAIDRLTRERDSLLKSLSKVERKLVKLNGQPQRRGPGRPPKPENGVVTRKRRKFSAATRRKMAKAAKERWAKIRADRMAESKTEVS